MRAAAAPLARAVVEGVDVTADSFYSSQGRTTSAFRDANEGLIARVRADVPGARSMQMETFHLFDLARCSAAASPIRASAAAIILASRACEFGKRNCARARSGAGARSPLSVRAQQQRGRSLTAVPGLSRDRSGGTRCGLRGGQGRSRCARARRRARVPRSAVRLRASVVSKAVCTGLSLNHAHGALDAHEARARPPSLSRP